MNNSKAWFKDFKTAYGYSKVTQTLVFTKPEESTLTTISIYTFREFHTDLAFDDATITATEVVTTVEKEKTTENDALVDETEGSKGKGSAKKKVAIKSDNNDKPAKVKKYDWPQESVKEGKEEEEASRELRKLDFYS